MSEQLAEAAVQLGLDMSSSQSEALLTYLGQMQRWNRTYNLTAVRDPQQMLVQHIFDSLSVVKPLCAGLAKSAGEGQIETGGRTLVDVGSGGGLPGVVLAIMCPQWTVYCVDTVEKKAAFVRQMASVLKLPNLKAAHARIENLAPIGADIIVSRAFSALTDFASLSGKHLGDNGKLAAMKGRMPTEEIEVLEAEGHWRVDEVHALNVPQLDAQRCLVWLSRQGNS